MKKIKLMLLSLSILAVVGGALAFTLKTQGDWCTAPTILDAQGHVTVSTTCSVRGKLKDGIGKNIATTTTSLNPNDPCPINLPCFATNPNKTAE